MAIFSSLHMKGKENVLIWEKYFDFFKMDKKNVQKKIVPIFYGKSIPCDHILKLSSGHQKNNFNFVTIKIL